MSTTSTSTSTLLNSSVLSSTSANLSIKPIPDYLTSSTLFEQRFMAWFFRKCPTLEAVRDFIKAQDDNPVQEFADNVVAIVNETSRQIPVKGMYFNLVDSSWRPVYDETTKLPMRLHLTWTSVMTPNPLTGQLGMFYDTLHDCCRRTIYRSSPRYLVGFGYKYDDVNKRVLSPASNVDLRRKDVRCGCYFKQWIKNGAERVYDIRPPGDTTNTMQTVYNDSRDYIQFGLWENKFLFWKIEKVDCKCNACSAKNNCTLTDNMAGREEGYITRQTQNVSTNLTDKSGPGWISLAPDILAIKPSVLNMFVVDNGLQYFTCNFGIYKDMMDGQLQRAFSNTYFASRQDTAECDVYMQQYCVAPANAEDSTCGCYNPFPAYSCSSDARSIVNDPNCLAKLVYDNQPATTSPGIEVCIMPKCRSFAAYRFEKHRALTSDRNMCPSQCLNIVNVVADRFAEVNMSDVRQTMSCSGTSATTLAPNIAVQATSPSDIIQQTSSGSVLPSLPNPATTPATADDGGDGGDGGDDSASNLSPSSIALIVVYSLIGLVVVVYVLYRLLRSQKK